MNDREEGEGTKKHFHVHGHLTRLNCMYVNKTIVDNQLPQTFSHAVIAAFVSVIECVSVGVLYILLCIPCVFLIKV